jgi:hypothetical protein
MQGVENKRWVGSIAIWIVTDTGNRV